jgi:KDO2-lipid IV(A) lauroyltransferase
MLCYPFFPKQTHALNDNIGQVLGRSDRERTRPLAREAFRNFGKFVIDFVRFPVLTKEEIRRRLVFHQWVELDEVMASKRGMIIVTMHFGAYDLGAAALGAYDYETFGVAESYGYHRMDELIITSRRQMGMNFIPNDKVTVGVFRAIKRGGILAMLIDVAPAGTEVTVDFMGARADVSSVPARVALRTGAWVVPVMVLRGPERDDIIRPVLDTQALRNFERSGDEERDVQEMTRRIMASYEAVLRQHPEQWLIFRRIWPGLEPAARDQRARQATGAQ